MKEKTLPLNISKLVKNVVFYLMPFVVGNNCMLRDTFDVTFIASVFLSRMVICGDVQTEIKLVFCFMQ